MAYIEAWIVVVVAAGLGTLGLVFLTREIQTDWLRLLLRVLPPVLLLVPAPIPQMSDNFAPAFVVLVFEGLFQREGSPAGSLIILATAAVLVVLLVLLLSRRSKISNSS